MGGVLRLQGCALCYQGMPPGGGGGLMKSSVQSNAWWSEGWGDRDAALCYEGMRGVVIWANRPLDVRFCEDTLQLPGGPPPRFDPCPPLPPIPTFSTLFLLCTLMSPHGCHPFSASLVASLCHNLGSTGATGDVGL